MVKEYVDIGAELLKDFEEGKISLPEKENEPACNNDKQEGLEICSERYFIDPFTEYLCRWKKTQNGNVPVVLANFQAEITKEIIEDNGLEQTYHYYIQGKIRDKQLPEIETTARDFASLNWLPKWGTQAIIEAGYSVKDYVRHYYNVSLKS